MITLSDITTMINQLLPEPHAGLLNGILFGTKAQLSLELKDALIRTGTLHIVALSGMNITILMSLGASTLLRVFSRKTTCLLTILFIMGFVWFVGYSPSVIRAAIMGCLTLLSVVFGRQKRAFIILLITVFLMVLIHVSYVTDLSFQLSVLATAGIILFGRTPTAQKVDKNVVRTIQNSIWNNIKDDFRTTLAAQVFTTPLLFITFHRISLLSPLANVLIGWIIQPLTVLGLVICIVGTIYFPLSVPLSWFAYVLLEYLVRIISLVGAIPFASVDWN